MKLQWHFNATSITSDAVADQLDNGLTDFAVICKPADLVNHHTRDMIDKDV